MAKESTLRADRNFDGTLHVEIDIRASDLVTMSPLRLRRLERAFEFLQAAFQPDPPSRKHKNGCVDIDPDHEGDCIEFFPGLLDDPPAGQ